MITPESALIYIMVVVSAADADMTDNELETIGDNVRHLPVFKGFAADRLPQVAAECNKLIAATDGLPKVLGLIRDALPESLYDTAYALACDVAAADSVVTPEEARMLELIRQNFSLDRLTAAAIERGARARYRRLTPAG
jgi:tellurite resistance protein